MAKKLIESDILFEVKDPLGRKIRTSKSYWEKIIKIKNPELKFGIDESKQALVNPDEIRRSVTDSTVVLYVRKVNDYDILIVTVKLLNGDGFIITVYQTQVYKAKGELVWQRT